MRDKIAKVLANNPQCNSAYEVACYAMHHALESWQRNTLAQLIEHGPIWDGNILSKNGRDDLISLGLASRACVKGQQGFTVANYIGWDVYQIGEV